jgi:hypothetical protein
MAEDWPDWLPTQNLQDAGVVYVIQQEKNGSFTIETADPEGTSTFALQDRGSLTHWLLTSYPGPLSPQARSKP